MSRKLILAFFLLSWLAACSGPPAGREVTIRLADPIGGLPFSAPLAYRVGTGRWSRAFESEPGVYRLALPAGEDRFGVAVNCPMALGLDMQAAWIKVRELSLKAGERSFTFGCRNVAPVTRARVRGSVAAGGAVYDKVLALTALDGIHGGAPLDFELALPPGENRELLVLTGQGRLNQGDLVHLKVLRGLDAAPGATLDLGTVGLGADDRLGTAQVEDYRGRLPSGFSSYYRVALATAAGLFYDGLGGGDASGGVWRTPPNPTADDRLVAVARAKKGLTRLYDVQVRAAGANDPVAFAFASPDGFSPTFAASDPPTFEQLTSDPPARGFELYYKQSFAGAVGMVEVLVSAGWLAGAERYDLGDLGALPGFQAAAIPSGSNGVWMAGALLMDTEVEKVLAGRRLAGGRSSGSFSYPLVPLPLEPGSRVRLVEKVGNFTVP